MDLIERYGWNSDIPSELTDYVKARKFYDYKDHSRVGAKHGEFVTDEICDRFCVIGSAEDVAKKLRELERVGVDQFNIYLMTHGQEEVLAGYGREIIPQFAGVPSA
jgi:alkanesulfonate monooxygenase SsuD/methylene tetrahydromethanopterin reductase-like flavin-dependent oxidoreductase (luciferase family)